MQKRPSASALSRWGSPIQPADRESWSCIVLLCCQESQSRICRIPVKQLCKPVTVKWSIRSVFGYVCVFTEASWEMQERRSPNTSCCCSLTGWEHLPPAFLLLLPHAQSANTANVFHQNTWMLRSPGNHNSFQEPGDTVWPREEIVQLNWACFLKGMGFMECFASFKAAAIKCPLQKIFFPYLQRGNASSYPANIHMFASHECMSPQDLLLLIAAWWRQADDRLKALPQSKGGCQGPPPWFFHSLQSLHHGERQGAFLHACTRTQEIKHTQRQSTLLLS